MSFTRDEHTTTTTDQETGTVETTTVWSDTDGDGNRTSSGWSCTETFKGGSSEAHVFQSFGEDGEPNGVVIDIAEKDEAGTVTESTRIIINEDGSKTTTTTNPDGSKTVTSYDKDGEVISKTESPADDDPDDFWDADIIYGEPGKEGKVSFADIDMQTEIAAVLEDYVDSFDFIM